MSRVTDSKSKFESDVKKKPLVKCRVCNAQVRQDRLDKHMRKVHPDQPQLSKPAIDKKIQRKPSITGGRKKPLPKQVDPEISISKVTLESKRGGRRIKGEGQQCNECGFSDEFLWKYTKSNFGVVYLCWRCKPKVFDRSFGKIDATRMTYPGHFESNPHRH